RGVRQPAEDFPGGRIEDVLLAAPLRRDEFTVDVETEILVHKERHLAVSGIRIGFGPILTRERESLLVLRAPRGAQLVLHRRRRLLVAEQLERVAALSAGDRLEPTLEVAELGHRRARVDRRQARAGRIGARDLPAPGRQLA